jgi:hypothetical protein
LLLLFLLHCNCSCFYVLLRCIGNVVYMTTEWRRSPLTSHFDISAQQKARVVTASTSLPQTPLSAHLHTTIKTGTVVPMNRRQNNLLSAHEEWCTCVH